MPETIITADDLKQELNPDDLRTVSYNDTAVMERAICKAVIWARGKVKSAGREYDETDEVIRGIVVKRAVYELFSYIGNESRARAKEEDAADLIETYFGSINTKYNNNESGPAAGMIAAGELPRYGC